MEKAKAVFFVVQAVALIVMWLATGLAQIYPQMACVGALETFSNGCAAILVASLVWQWASCAVQNRITREQEEIKQFQEWDALHQKQAQ